MAQGQVLDFLRQAMWTACLVSLPVLGVALVVGVAISVVQAMTQVQEATLSFVPKVGAVMLSLVVLGPWMMATMVRFTVSVFQNLPHLVR